MCYFTWSVFSSFLFLQLFIRDYLNFSFARKHRWPQSGEIDIMENIGKEGPNTVHGTVSFRTIVEMPTRRNCPNCAGCGKRRYRNLCYWGKCEMARITISLSCAYHNNNAYPQVHYGLSWPQHQYSEAGITLSAPPASMENLNETFHTYAVERLPGEIRWFIDDIEYSSITQEEMKPYHWPFDEEFYFILNLAVGGNWPGNPVDEEHPGDDEYSEATIFPQTLEFDYVRVYEGVFPRLLGKHIVECTEKNVIYDIVNVEQLEDVKEDISFTWAVPRGATITKGQGTSRIYVDFDSLIDESNINDSEVIHVQATGFNSRHVSNSIGVTKLQQNGIGLRIKIIDFDGTCSSNNTTGVAVPKFGFDCGRPSTCTQYVLHRTTDEFTCGERIQWLIEEMGMGERDACREVGYVQFHGHCGPCNPME